MHKTDQFRYLFLKILVFVICLVFYGYHILAFALLRRIVDIRIFRFDSEHITNQIKIYVYFIQPHS